MIHIPCSSVTITMPLAVRLSHPVKTPSASTAPMITPAAAGSRANPRVAHSATPHRDEARTYRGHTDLGEALIELAGIAEEHTVRDDVGGNESAQCSGRENRYNPNILKHKCLCRDVVSYRAS